MGQAGGRLSRCRWNSACEGEARVSLRLDLSSQRDLAVDMREDMVGALAKGAAAVDEDPASAHRTRVHVGDDRRDGAGPALEEALQDGSMDVEADMDHAR